MYEYFQYFVNLLTLSLERNIILLYTKDLQSQNYESQVELDPLTAFIRYSKGQ